MAKTPKINKPYLLIVEGKDEENFFSVLFEKLSINNIQIVVIGGKPALNTSFIPLFSTEIRSLQDVELKSVGIVLDADYKNNSNDNVMVKNTQKIQTFIETFNKKNPNNKLSKPIEPSEFHKENDLPAVGFFIMPNNNNEGMFETLLINAIKESPMMECVNSFIACVKSKTKECDNIGWEDKRKAVGYLLAKYVEKDSCEKKSEERKSIESINCDETNIFIDEKYAFRYFNLDSPVYNEIKDFILKLNEA